MIKSVKVWTRNRLNAHFEIDSDPWYTCYGLLHSEYGTLKPESFFGPITVYTVCFPTEDQKRERGEREKES